MNMWMAYHLALGALALFYVLGRGPRSSAMDWVALIPNLVGVFLGLVIFATVAHECAAHSGNLFDDAIQQNGKILLIVNFISTAFHAIRSTK